MNQKQAKEKKQAKEILQKAKAKHVKLVAFCVDNLKTMGTENFELMQSKISFLVKIIKELEPIDMNALHEKAMKSAKENGSWDRMDTNLTNK